MKPPRQCLDCPAMTRRSRCPHCEAKLDRSRIQYRGPWQTIRKAAYPPVGTRCPICQVPMIRSRTARNAMTLDHEHAQVECRECNSRHRRNAR